MHICHIQGIFSPEHGGPCHSLTNYCQGQVQQGHEVSAWVLEGYPHTSPAIRLPPPVQMFVHRVGFPAKLGRSAEMRARLAGAEAADIYHLHGTWLRAMHYGALAARRHRRPYLVELMGMYDPYGLRQKGLQKWLTRHWFQDDLLRRASGLHVNSPREANQLRRLGFRAPLAVIPVGVDSNLIARQQKSLPAASPWPELEKAPFLLYLARIHQKKGIELLLHAWAKLASRFPDWQLAVAGTGAPDYLQKCRQMAGDLGVASRCVWTGQVNEAQKTWLYTHAACYVLPTYAENFGNTVAEALAHGTPVVTTHGTPWEELPVKNCGWLAEASGPSLESVLSEALDTDPACRKKMGERGRQLVEEHYSLAYVLGALERMYRWLSGGPEPEDILQKL